MDRHRTPRVQSKLLAWLVVAALLFAPQFAHAQSAAMSAVANYQGADRTQKLIDGARKEGGLTFYASIPTGDIAALVGPFEKKYGIKVNVWRADSEGFLQRIVNEARARRFDVDVMSGSSSAIEPLFRENMLQEVKSPFLDDVIPESIAPHRQWASVYLNTVVQAYNTKLVDKANLPKTFRDFLKPEWKGKLGIEAEDFDWFAQVVTDLGEADGLKLFSEIVATNGISVRKGHTLLNNLVAAGEVPLALTVYGFIAEQAKNKGAPVDWFVIPPLIARPTAVGVARNAPHPYASVLFFDFLIGEGQEILAKRDFVTVSKKIPSPYLKAPLKLIDFGMMLDNAQKWQDLYQKIVISPSH